VRTPLLGVLALLPGLALLAGCDANGADEANRSGPAVSATADAAYEEASDQLCATAQAEQEAIRRRRGGDQITLDDRARLLVELAPSRARLAGDLGQLEAAPGDRALHRRLVAAARRRASASRRAGELWGNGAPERRIAAAAAAEHLQRERFVAVAARLGLGDCAEVLSGRDRRLIGEAVERGLAAPAAGSRCAALAERYLHELYGGRANCRRARADETRRRASVIVGESQGIDGVFAVARATVGRGSRREKLRIRLVFERDGYRIDKID
jgi:hypothetical protein